MFMAVARMAARARDTTADDITGKNSLAGFSIPGDERMDSASKGNAVFAILRSRPRLTIKG